MKNYDYWKSFVNTGKIDDYLHYVACTREEIFDESTKRADTSDRGRTVSSGGDDLSLYCRE